MRREPRQSVVTSNNDVWGLEGTSEYARVKSVSIAMMEGSAIWEPDGVDKLLDIRWTLTYHLCAEKYWKQQATVS